ncbi:MAG: DUF1800 domain-containing protein [Rubripirellula sp.]
MRNFVVGAIPRLAFSAFMVFCVGDVLGGTFEVDSSRDISLMKRKIRASQFLHRATFGPTIEQIDALAARMQQVGVRRACDEWIEEQFAMPASEHQNLAETMIADDGYTTATGDVWIQRYRYHAWWHHALTADDQLRQRTAWALIQILVTSEQGSGFNDQNPGNISGLGRWLGPTNYYDVLVNNAFGNYRDILEEVTYHPVMGVYLSHMRNRKTNGTRFPDENYAREIMQLFSIGLYELHVDGRFRHAEDGSLIPTYDNETIKNFARVFTGLTFKPSNTDNFFWSGNDFQYPMEMHQPEHDTDPKTLLNGEVVDIEDGNADIQAALDNLFNHNNVAPFIAHRLIQRFVKSNPSRAYVRRVARKFNDNGAGVKGDMKTVIKAVLLDPEAWRSIRLQSFRNPNRVVATARGTEFSRLREPIIRYAALLRACDVSSDYANGHMMVTPLSWAWLQESYQSPSVFNFFLPNFQPPGELLGFRPSRRVPNDALVAPEFQQKTAVTSNYLMSKYVWDISAQNARFTFNGTECNLQFNLADEKALATQDEDMPKLLDLLDLVYCCGTMPQDYKNRVVEVINAETQWMKNSDQWKPELENFRVESALLQVATSPFSAIGE